ncbi:hypothetical protein DFH27DRAFT_648710 [Peziza echinospora]|nr:hypothetical protein DFH27DRAFT_648710 [Peziza echinospora]
MNWTGGGRARHNGNSGLNAATRAQAQFFAKVRLGRDAVPSGSGADRHRMRSSSPNTIDNVVAVPWAKGEKARLKTPEPGSNLLNILSKNAKLGQQTQFTRSKSLGQLKADEAPALDSHDDRGKGKGKRKEIGDWRQNKDMILQDDDWLGLQSTLRIGAIVDEEDSQRHKRRKTRRHSIHSVLRHEERIIENKGIQHAELLFAKQKLPKPSKPSRRHPDVSPESPQTPYPQRNNQHRKRSKTTRHGGEIPDDDEESLLLEVGNNRFTKSHNQRGLSHRVLLNVMDKEPPDHANSHDHDSSSDSMLLDFERGLYLPVPVLNHAPDQEVEYSEAHVTENPPVAEDEGSATTYFTWSSSSYAGKPPRLVGPPKQANEDVESENLRQQGLDKENIRTLSGSRHISPLRSENSPRFAPTVNHEFNEVEYNSSVVAHAASASEEAMEDYKFGDNSSEDLAWIENLLQGCQGPEENLDEQSMDNFNAESTSLNGEDRPEEESSWIQPNGGIFTEDAAENHPALCDEEADDDWIWGAIPSPSISESHGSEVHSIEATSEPMRPVDGNLGGGDFQISSHSSESRSEILMNPQGGAASNDDPVLNDCPVLNDPVCNDGSEQEEHSAELNQTEHLASTHEPRTAILQLAKPNVTIPTTQEREEFNECYGPGVLIDLQQGEEQAWANFVYTTCGSANLDIYNDWTTEPSLAKLQSNIAGGLFREEDESLEPLEFSKHNAPSNVPESESIISFDDTRSDAATAGTQLPLSPSPISIELLGEGTQFPASSLAGNVSSSSHGDGVDSVAATRVSSPAAMPLHNLSSSNVDNSSDQGQQSENSSNYFTDPNAQRPLLPATTPPRLKIKSTIRSKTTHGRSETTKRVMWAEDVLQFSPRASEDTGPVSRGVENPNLNSRSKAGGESNDGGTAHQTRVRSITQIQGVFSTSKGKEPVRKSPPPPVTPGDEIEEW